MRNFKRSAKHTEIVLRLTDQQHSLTKQPIFPSLRELLCFAAVLGFQCERREQLPPDSDLFVDARPFSNSEVALDLLYLIGLAGTKDVNVLREEREDEVVQIFEEYANGGLMILKSWLASSPEDIDGDKAILKGLSESGFLISEAKPLAAAAGEVTF